MVRAVFIAVLGLVGGVYLLVTGWAALAQGNASRATPVPMTYEAFVADPPAPGTIVEITGGFLLPNCVNETDNAGTQTGAYSGIAPISDAPVRGVNASQRFTGSSPEILAIASPIDGSGEFNQLAFGRTHTGLVLPTDHRIDAELTRLVAGSFPDLDLATCPKLRIALHDTTNAGYARMGGGALLILLPLLNVVMAIRKQ